MDSYEALINLCEKSHNLGLEDSYKFGNIIEKDLQITKIIKKYLKEIYFDPKMYRFKIFLGLDNKQLEIELFKDKLTEIQLNDLNQFKEWLNDK